MKSETLEVLLIQLARVEQNAIIILKKCNEE